MAGGTDLIVDAQGPDPLVVTLSDRAVEVSMPDEPLTIEFEAVGVPGRDGADGAVADIQAVAADLLPAGMPVAIDRTSAKFIMADASYKPAAFVAGLLRAGSTIGFVAGAAVQRLTLNDWSAVTGTAQLASGQPYFLAVGGGLTTVAPASDCVALIGSALNPTTLLIDPQPPIEL